MQRTEAKVRRLNESYYDLLTLAVCINQTSNGSSTLENKITLTRKNVLRGTNNRNTISQPADIYRETEFHVYYRKESFLYILVLYLCFTRCTILFKGWKHAIYIVMIFRTPRRKKQARSWKKWTSLAGRRREIKIFGGTWISGNLIGIPFRATWKLDLARFKRFSVAYRGDTRYHGSSGREKREEARWPTRRKINPRGERTEWLSSRFYLSSSLSPRRVIYATLVFLN